MTREQIISKAKRMKLVKDGLVRCENCDNPASLSLSKSLSWIACAPCVWGESDSLDETDFIVADVKK